MLDSGQSETLDFTAPEVDSLTDVELTVPGASLTIQVRPPPGTITGESKPAEIVLGKLDGSTLLIASKQAILIRTGAGSIENIEALLDRALRPGGLGRLGRVDRGQQRRDGLAVRGGNYAPPVLAFDPDQKVTVT